MKVFYTSNSFLGIIPRKVISCIMFTVILIFAKQQAFAVATITSTAPVNNATNVNVNPFNYRVNFSFSGGYNPGNTVSTVLFKNATTGASIYEVTVSTNIYTAGRLDVPMPGPLPDNTQIQVVITGIDFDLSNNGIFYFTTQNNAPKVTSILPSTDIGLRDTTKTFRLVFSENIVKGTGNILFTSKAGAVLQTISVASSSVTVGLNTAIVKVPSNWTLGTQFNVSASAGTFKDATALNNVAYTSPYYTVYDPTAVLQKIGQSPASTDTIASTATTIKIIFNKPVLLSTAASGGGSPDIIIQNGLGGATIYRTFGTMGATFSGNELTLKYSGGYWPFTGENIIRLAQSSVKDAAGNVLTTEVTASFYVKCIVVPPTPAPLVVSVGDTNTCRNSTITLTTSNISGVIYDWQSYGAANTPTGSNTSSFYYPNTGTYSIGVATSQGPCLSTRIYKTIKVKSPISVVAGISGPSQVLTGVASNYFSGATFGENLNVDSVKWYQDAVYKGLGDSKALTWNTTGTKQVRIVYKNRCSTIEKTLSVNVVSSDVTPPSISSLSPANNATNVAVGANLIATFSETIVAGTGIIYIVNKANSATFASYSMNSPNLTISGNTLTINPSTDLVNGINYYVTIPTGAVKDVAGNNFAGFTSTNTWSFTAAAAADLTPPIATTLSPANLSTGVDLNTNLVLTFSEPIIKTKGVLVQLAKGAVVVGNYTTDSPEVTISGNAMTIIPGFSLDPGYSYNLYIGSGAVKDLAGNSFADFTNASFWSFTTLADVTSPSIISSVPANGEQNASATANIVFTFSEPIVKVSGKPVVITNTTTNTVEGNYTTDSPEVEFFGNTITINPTNNLAFNTNYSVYILNSGIIDLSGNLATSTFINFKTGPDPNADVTNPTLVSLSPINNATNVALNANLVVTFSEPVVKVSGKAVQIIKLNGDVVEFPYSTDSPEVTFSGNTMTINPASNLAANTVYYVYLTGGYCKDLAGNTIQSGFTNSNGWKFTTTSITGLENETTNQSITVWPNPVQNELNIQVEGLISAEIFDMTGVEVTKGNSNTMNVSDLASGVYILNVKTSNGNFKKQIVKK
jgi:large repetitive protein